MAFTDMGDQFIAAHFGRVGAVGKEKSGGKNQLRERLNLNGAVVAQPAEIRP
jgi:hypothetical protein